MYLKKMALLSAFIGLLLAHFVTKAEQTKVTTITDLKGQYLFLQNAQTVIIKPVQNKPGIYTLTFKGVSPLVLYISDRPNRKTGHLRLEEFLRLWTFKNANGFKSNPPNAILSSSHPGIQMSEQPIHFSFELSNPQFDVKTNTVSFIAKALEGTPLIKTSQTLEQVNLFVDDVCLSCW